LSEIDFTDLDNFASGFPHSLFEVHRREAPSETGKFVFSKEFELF